MGLLVAVWRGGFVCTWVLDLQDEHADHDGKDAVAGTGHGQGEVDDVEDALDYVDAEEEWWGQLPPGAHDDADDVEEQTEDDDGHDDTGHGQNGIVLKRRVVLVVESFHIVLEYAETGNDQYVQADLNEHDEDPNYPERDQNPLQEWRRIADNVRARHGCWMLEMVA